MQEDSESDLDSLKNLDGFGIPFGLMKKIEESKALLSTIQKKSIIKIEQTQ